MRNVAAMKICAYLPVPPRTPRSTVLTAGAARQFAAYLEAAPARAAAPAPCPSNTGVVGSELAVLAVSGDARPLKPVAITVSPWRQSGDQRHRGALPRQVAEAGGRLLDSAVGMNAAPRKPGSSGPS